MSNTNYKFPQIKNSDDEKEEEEMKLLGTQLVFKLNDINSKFMERR